MDVQSRIGSEFKQFDFGDSPIAQTLAADINHDRKLKSSIFPKPLKTHIISVTNQKGGVGKTTTAVNLAAALASGGLKVMVIDMDPQGNASTALGIEHGDARKPSSAQMLIDNETLANCIKQSPHFDTLSVVPSTIDLSSADIKLSDTENKEFRLKNALEEFLKEDDTYDYIFIDCPPSMGILVVNALSAASEILVTIQAEYYALEGLSLLYDTVNFVRDQYNPELEITAALVTMFDRRTNLSNEVYDEVKNFFPTQTLGTVIPRNVQISEAPSHLETVITYDPRSAGSLAYREAALELAKRGAKKPSAPSNGEDSEGDA
jgi:chromosome partitioning protein